MFDVIVSVSSGAIRRTVLTNNQKLEEKEERSIAEQEKLAQAPSLAVTPEPHANETRKDSEKKLCPTCNRTHLDDSLNCLLDYGTPAVTYPEVTLARRNAPSSKLRGTISYPPFPSSQSSYRRGLYVAILLVLMGAGAVALVQELNEHHSPTSAAKPRESSPPLPTPVSKQIEQKGSGAQNLTGQWKVVNIIQKTSDRSSPNVEIGFRLFINQTGTDFTAEGEKVSENGRILPAAGRTPIHVTGFIDGERLEATFMEERMRRKTRGRFVWRIQSPANKRGNKESEPESSIVKKVSRVGNPQNNAKKESRIGSFLKKAGRKLKTFRF